MSEASPTVIDIKKPGFQGFNLKQEVIRGLSQKQKNVSTLALYDDMGLQLFDQVTYAPEYYLTQSEIDILSANIVSMVASIPDNSVIVELGSGSLRKTKLLLDAVNKARRNVSYYALDLMEQELKRSLTSLGNYENITTYGMWGTYDDGMDYLLTFPKPTVKTVLWMGSSIGNLPRQEARDFMHRLQTKLNPGDRILVGIDLRKQPEKISLAYDDAGGANRSFIMNALVHCNHALNYEVFSLQHFKYVNNVNHDSGIREGAYQVQSDHKVTYLDPDSGTTHEFAFTKGEVINLVCSVKYSTEEIEVLCQHAQLVSAAQWSDGQYTLNLFVKPHLSPILNISSWESIAEIHPELYLIHTASLQATLS